MTEATAADHAWFNDHWLRRTFCITLVRGLDEAEVGELLEPLAARYLELVLVATADGWSVAVEDNGFEGWRPEVLRALSRGAQVVSVFDNSIEGDFS